MGEPCEHMKINALSERGKDWMEKQLQFVFLKC